MVRIVRFENLLCYACEKNLNRSNSLENGENCARCADNRHYRRSFSTLSKTITYAKYIDSRAPPRRKNPNRPVRAFRLSVHSSVSKTFSRLIWSHTALYFAQEAPDLYASSDSPRLGSKCCVLNGPIGGFHVNGLYRAPATPLDPGIVARCALPGALIGPNAHRPIASRMPSAYERMFYIS